MLRIFVYKFIFKDTVFQVVNDQIKLCFRNRVHEEGKHLKCALSAAKDHQIVANEISSVGKVGREGVN